MGMNALRWPGTIAALASAIGWRSTTPVW